MESHQASVDWRAYHGWKSNIIRSSTPGGLTTRWIIAIAWSFPTAGSLILMSHAIEERDILGLLTLIFPLIAIIFYYRALSPILSEIRFGPAIFDMSSYPALTGQRLEGRVRGAAFANMSEAPFNVTLRCMRQKSSWNGSDKTTQNVQVWSTTTPCHVSRNSQGYGLDINIDIPNTSRGADIGRNFDHYYWLLSVKGETAGPDFFRQFDLPIFKPESNYA